MGGDLRENGSEYTGINEGQQSQEGGGSMLGQQSHRFAAEHSAPKDILVHRNIFQ